MATKRNYVVLDGEVIVAYPDGIFLVRLDNEMEVLTTISGQMRYRIVRVVPGDRVKVEIPIYDLTRGRIIYRYPVKRNDEFAQDF
uniref:Translation initiation factor IF-1, chloroplastic n=2 Tax=Taiwania TaxID=25613 RepID=R4LC89_9CONI|nr:translation initiation factor 1 [Taiwania cryptomerioides]YP_008082433.1 translation initiation factor 1 [Taiwania flousiana]AGL11279.1 translation initiation factor 1 [Taiwania flousiana]AVR43523.1 translation initiation factor 1 [Taiwania cryptomerioides]QJE37041.1 translation initiation factor 1 [Taiwania flousiana]QJE37124.1 translation initiation factor 1 [Taiwania flousiana]BAK86849.1 translation initiation factor 1 [Taiwania cryptomerioides]